MAEWLQVVHKVNRIRRNTFSEKFLMREERKKHDETGVE